MLNTETPLPQMCDQLFRKRCIVVKVRQKGKLTAEKYFQPLKLYYIRQEPLRKTNDYNSKYVQGLKNNFLSCFGRPHAFIS